MRVLLISDIHANQLAIEAVLADCPAVDAIWNLGDTIGYGPRPRECIDLMVAHGVDPALVGNHDLACIGDLDLAAFNPVAQIAARWTATQLGPDHRAYLEALPPLTTAAGYTLAHGSPRHPVWEYVVDAETATDNFAHFATDVCFVGHSHVALYAMLGEGKTTAEVQALRDGETLDLSNGRYVINPGSVGQPRDGDPRAAYAILDADRRTVTGHRVAYDIAETQRQMAGADLPALLIARLSRGL